MLLMYTVYEPAEGLSIAVPYNEKLEEDKAYWIVR